MMARPIGALELHYPMIQFLVKMIIHVGHRMGQVPNVSLTQNKRYT